MTRRIAEPEILGSVRIGTIEVPYEIVRSPRARRVGLRIGPRPVVEIIVPERARLSDVSELLRPHHVWIRKQLARLAEVPATGMELSSGMSLPFHGQDLTLVIGDGPPGRCTVSRWDSRLVVAAPAGDARLLAAGLESWYRQQARYVFYQRSEYWARKLGVQFNRLTIKDQRTRWGSCSSLGNLNFNWRLLLAPGAVLDYVVIHELTHLIEPSHGPAFWRRVERFCPAYAERVTWLDQNGEHLAAYFR